MFRFSLRKMLKNRWLTISLLIGYLMAVAIVASMPIYSHAILDRMLQKDLGQIQTQSRTYPGKISAEASLTAGAAAQSAKTRAFRQYAWRQSVPLYWQRTPWETIGARL